MRVPGAPGSRIVPEKDESAGGRGRSLAQGLLSLLSLLVSDAKTTRESTGL